MAIINIFGASGHAKVIADIISAQGDKVGSVYDDAPEGKSIADKPVCRPDHGLSDNPVIIAIGSNRIRKMISEKYPVGFAMACHPAAVISNSAVIGEGTVVMARAVIEADVRIGRHCIINTGATINHECRLDDFVHVSPGATLCGNVSVGECSWIGAGATVIPGIRIGSNCIIGAGAVVIRDVPDGAKVAGNPARMLELD